MELLNFKITLQLAELDLVTIESFNFSGDIPVDIQTVPFLFEVTFSFNFLVYPFY